MLTGLLLIVAVLSFAGFAYQTVPASTTETITQESTESLVSYSPFTVTNTLTYTTSAVMVVWGGNLPGNSCPPGGCCVPQPGEETFCLPSGQTVNYYFTERHTVSQPYLAQSTATIQYSRTLTSSITESSTSLVPAYSTVGLTDTAFGALSILVIGILALVTGWVALKSRHVQGEKQATMSQFMKSSDTCVNCGADLPPNSTFCNKCGTKQS